MKKVLFATTALIATAGMAAAEVKIGGYGRFGLDYNDANGTVPGVSKYNITSRLRLQFDMSAQTDSGVAFDARFRAQAESRDGVAGGAFFNGARFGVSYEGIRVNVGNIIGAMENTPGLYTTGTRSAGTGIDGMGFFSIPFSGASKWGWDAYSSGGTGVNGVEVLYSAGGFVGHLSYSRRNGGAVPGQANGETRTALMLTYNFGDFYVAGSMTNSSGALRPLLANGQDANDLMLLTAGGNFGSFGAKIAYGDANNGKGITLEGNMDIGTASNVLVWVGNFDPKKVGGVAVDPTAVDGTNYGINYQYDLGGGATFVAGYVHNAKTNVAGDTSDNQVQAGVYFSF